LTYLDIEKSSFAALFIFGPKPPTSVGGYHSKGFACKDLPMLIAVLIFRGVKRGN
jgi:hypothetical protein